MQPRFMLPVIFAVSTLILTGCVDNSAPAGPAETSTEGAAAVDEAAAALLPESVKAGGTLSIGSDASYAPNEFKDESGEPIGWGIEIATVIAAKLGLTPTFQVAKFDNIIPSITGGKVDIGMSSFLDTVEREKQVDFVNYYSAGTQWAAPAGSAVDPDQACGLTVAVQQSTYQDTVEIPTKNAACLAAGLPGIATLPFDTQDAATSAATLGQADAVTAASPVILYGIGKLEGKLDTVGETFSVSPYGIAIGKDSGLVEAITAAVQSMIDDGSYDAILTEWNVQDGAIETATVNAGANG